MDHLKSSFDAFFKSEAKVAALKGSWGVGKTYFWDAYVSDRISQKNLNQIAYSYISLFGKTSLGDVKKSLFHSAKAISSDSEIDNAFDNEFTKSSNLINKVPWIKGGVNKTHSKTPLLSWFTKNVQNIPAIGKFSDVITRFEYSLVNNYVICFDDLERKGSSLSVREIMGLIDELALRKNCKIVLIFNESSLDEKSDKKEFDSYREKVVDIELNHDPSCLDNLKLVFKEDRSQLSTIEELVRELNIKNIRVLKKIKWVIDSFDCFFEGKHQKIKEEFLVHGIILCWAYFIHDEELSFNELKKQLNENSWMSFIAEEDNDKTPGEIRYSTIASNLNLSFSKFDRHIIYYLEHGFIQKNDLIETISDLTKNIEVQLVSSKLKKAWGIYSESFSDNLDEFKSALRVVLYEDISKLDLSSFSSAINILEDFGDDISKYVIDYTEMHKESLKKIDPYDSWDMDRLKNSSLRKSIEELHNKSKNLNLDEVSEKIAVNKGWASEDTDFLASLNKNDFYTWMKSNPSKLTKKIRGGLLTFKNLNTSNENDRAKYQKITTNVIDALKDISNESSLNKKRVKYIYGVEWLAS